MGKKKTSTLPYTQLLTVLKQMGKSEKKSQTYICMGPGMLQSDRIIYGNIDIISDREEIEKYAAQIAYLIMNNKIQNSGLTFDFLFRVPEKDSLSLFGIHDYQKDGVSKIYERFTAEILKACNGDMKKLAEIRLPIKPVFLRVDLIRFRPSIHEYTSGVMNEKNVTEYFEFLDYLSTLNEKIVNADIFFKALKEKGIDLQLDGESLTFKRYMLYTLSGNNPENIIKTPAAKPVKAENTEPIETDAEPSSHTWTLTKKIPTPANAMPLRRTAP